MPDWIPDKPTETATADWVPDAQAAAPPAKKEKGFLGRVFDDLGNRRKEMADISRGRYPDLESTLQVSGQLAGGVGDILGQSTKSLWNTLAPDDLKKSISNIVGGIANTDIGKQGVEALQAGAKKWESFKKNYPDVAKDIEATFNIASIIPAGKGASAVKGAANIGEKSIARDTAALGKEFKIPTTLGEETKNPIIQKAESLLENVPIVGIKRFREKQSEAATTAAKEYLSKFIADPTAADTMASNRAFSSSMYKELEQKVANVGGSIIEPTNTKKIAGELLSRYPDTFKMLQDTRTEAILNNIAKDTSDKTVISNLLDAKGNPIRTTKPPELTFKDMWDLRGGLGDKIGQARKKLNAGELDQTQYGQVKALFKAVNEDIETWTKNIGRPDIKSAITEANDAYKHYVVKYDAVQRAYTKAAGVEGVDRLFSPQKFSTALENIIKKNDVYKTFTPEEIKEMTGLANIMQVVRRAGQYMENPPTGNRWGAVLTGGLLEGSAYAAGGALAAVKTAGATLAISSVAKFITTTEAGKSLALRAATLQPTSQEMRNVFIEVMKQSPKFATTGTANLAGKKIDEQPKTENTNISDMQWRD